MSKCHIPKKNASSRLNNSTATTPWVHLTRCAHGVVAVANGGPAGPLGATRPQVKKEKNTSPLARNRFRWGRPKKAHFY